MVSGLTTVAPEGVWRRSNGCGVVSGGKSIWSYYVIIIFSVQLRPFLHGVIWICTHKVINVHQTIRNY